MGRTRRRVAAELIADLERIHARKKAANKELTELVTATGTSLLDLHGIGPTGAARLLVEVGDITRFPSKAHFASWNGTAPLDASSGDQVRHRLSRKSNRQINRVLHTMARVQLRNPTEGRAYLFKVQRFQLAAYHVTDASDFYEANDKWKVPVDPNDQPACSRHTASRCPPIGSRTPSP